MRVSGPLACKVAVGVLGNIPEPRRAVFRRFRDVAGDIIDTGLALYFPAPHSFTGEDVLELQGHGGPVVMDLLLAQVLQLGARLARPGEFSQRAFLNGKLDLVQAEAIADLIDSASEAAARSAQCTLQGEFSKHVQSVLGRLVELRVAVEATLDFPEEELDGLTKANVAAGLQEVSEIIAGTLASATRGRLLREGLTVVIAGRPNVGKSSLLNRLAEREAAIVTAIPGTTRDVLREQIQIDGVPLHIVDTAGLRTTWDIVERQGVSRAWEAVRSADVVVLVVDDQAGLGAEEEAILGQLADRPELLVVRNKVDLSGAQPGLVTGSKPPAVRISAMTGAGLDPLRQQLKLVAGCRQTTEGLFLARRRHLEALQRSQAAVESARRQLSRFCAVELVAEDLREAQRALGEITGEFTSEQLLERIFSSFCVGK